MGTFVTSVAGALFFTVLPATAGVSPLPDWPLGVLLGMGGFIGMYLGAKSQKYLPQKAIKAIVACAILFLAVRYIVQFR